jgi:hypothetical protein
VRLLFIFLEYVILGLHQCKDLLSFFCVFIFNRLAQEAFLDYILPFLDDPIFLLLGGLKGFPKMRDDSYIVAVYYLAFGNLSIVLRQRVQMLTLRRTPLISIRRRSTFNTKRRRVRFCEKLTLLPYIGLRSQISQRPDIKLFLSISFKVLM